MTPDIGLSGADCTTGFTPRQLVQSSSENDKRTRMAMGGKSPFSLPATRTVGGDASGACPALAIERYRVHEPHLADGIPLADLARTGTLSERTLQRWLGRYRAEGLAGLARLPRNDRGRLHLPEHLVELTRLSPPSARDPRSPPFTERCELAIAHGHRTPSYAAVARVVRAIPASQIAAASDPAVYRDQHELVHRREARPRTRCGRPIIPFSTFSCSMMPEPRCVLG
jgi:transposase